MAQFLEEPLATIRKPNSELGKHFFFYKFHERKVKDYLSDLGISIIVSGTQTVGTHPVTFATCGKVVAHHPGDISGSMHSQQNE